jgi:alkaline phosphatase
MRTTRTIVFVALVLTAQAWGAGKKAKNVILFLGDAGGIPTLHAASVQAFNDPAKLYIQHMPHLALSDTSSATDWVTDSAAGMTAIVTGQKTKNGVLSEAVPAQGEAEGKALKTILEYAEEHGLSTGVISNSPMWDATPAACYAHAVSRRQAGPIFAQVLKPRFGDGVDLVIGPGRKAILDATRAMGIDLAAELPRKGFYFSDTMQGLPAGARRAVILNDDADFDIDTATRLAVDILSKNPKGFFLMVESDVHTDKLPRGLDRVPKFDRLIESMASRLRNNTLLIFTADHSFDLRVAGSAPKGQPLVTLDAAGKGVPAKGLVIQGHHSGEQVLVAAEGPGSERVHGFIANTDLFRIMLEAYGWKASEDAAAGRP